MADFKPLCAYFDMPEKTAFKTSLNFISTKALNSQSRDKKKR